MANRELLSLSLYSLLANNRSGLFIVFLPLYLVELKGATLPIALAILTFAYVPASLIGPLVGRLSDRAGRRRPYLLLGEALAFPLFLAVTFAPGYALAGALFIAAELALAIGGPAYTAYVADVTRANERGAGYGLLNATSNAGAVVGVILAGVVTFEFGLVALFPFVVAVMIGTLSVVIFLVPDIRLPPTPTRRPLREMRPIVVFSFAVSIRAIGAGAVAAFYGYLAASLGANNLEVSVVAVAGLVTGAIVSLPLGRLIDRRGEIRGIWYGTLLTLGSYGLFMVSTTWPETVPAQSVRNAGLALVGTGMPAWVARMAPDGHRAEYLGMFSLINSSLWSVGPLVGAVAIAYFGYLGLFTMAIATTIVSLAVMEVLYGEIGFRSRPGRAAGGPLP
ncbi:MAG TPA: MFS transporter [Thermoplasmata archaeon]|nr:MFS transporter [Thermoplasmata archaeon]